MVGVVWTFQANTTSCTWEKPFLFRGCFGVSIIGLILIGLFVLVSLGIAMFLSVVHYLYPPEGNFVLKKKKKKKKNLKTCVFYY